MAILVLEFRTFRSTLIVASVIPLGVAGGVLALLLVGQTLSFAATIGFVALIGIEIKESIEPLLARIVTPVMYKLLAPRVEAVVREAE